MKKLQRLLAFLIFLYFLPVLLTYGVMTYASQSSFDQSPLAKEAYALHIPSGLQTPLTLDWYPKMHIYYNGYQPLSEGASPCDLTIYYTYGDFDLYARNSTLYHSDSPYFSAFYGAYVLHNEDLTRLSDEALAGRLLEVSRYDYLRLVSDALYNQDAPFVVVSSTLERSIPFLESNDWIKLTATVATEGFNHAYSPKHFSLSYLQYGLPTLGKAQPYLPVTLYATTYVHYEERLHATVALYVISTSPEVNDRTVTAFLAKTTLTKTE